MCKLLFSKLFFNIIVKCLALLFQIILPLSTSKWPLFKIYWFDCIYVCISILLQMTLFHSFFYGWVVYFIMHVCVCVYIHIYVNFLYPCFQPWTFKLLPSPAYLNSAAMNIGVYVYFQIMVLSRYMPRSGIAGSYGNSIITC